MSPEAHLPHPVRSIRDVVDHLIHEFDGRVPTRGITEVVIRLSANGAVSLPVLAHLARQELEALARSA